MGSPSRVGSGSESAIRIKSARRGVISYSFCAPYLYTTNKTLHLVIVRDPESYSSVPTFSA
jgi:hypothetical protein